MSYITSDDQELDHWARRLESGLPLGGIGAGAIEFCADGRFTNVTTNNNWDSPIIDGRAKMPPEPRIKEGFTGSVAENYTRRQALFSAEGLPGAWLAVHTPALGARVLKVVSRSAITPLDPNAIHFHGRFPRAVVTYDGLETIALELEAFSAFDLPDDSEGYQNSSLPLGLFHFTVRNQTNQPTPVSLVFSWQNLNGLGGYAGMPINRPDPTPPVFREDPFAPGLVFGHTPDKPVDPRVVGDFSLRVTSDIDGAQVSNFLGWDQAGDGSDVWDHFAREGRLSNQSGSGTAGALGLQFILPGSGLASVVFAMAWNMPRLLAAVVENDHLVRHSSPPPDPGWGFGDDRPDYGHAYNRWFDHSWEVAGFGLEHWQEIRQRYAAWQDALAGSGVPEFFVEACCNDLFPLFSNSWYTLDGKYSVNEAPTDMKGCMGTIDQRAVANAVVACAYPDLDRSELEMFAADQIRAEGDSRRFGFHWNTRTGRFDNLLDRAGAILHDIGWDHLEGGRTGRQAWLSAHWPDLSSVFVLQVYQHGIWNGSGDWLKTMYPHVKDALRFQARLDQNGNGVADLWGSGCCTYDTELYPYFGSSSFVASLYLAALRAAERMAKDFGDMAFAGEARERFARAQRVLEEDLWHEELGFYRSWIDPDHSAWENTPYAHGPESLNCHIGQLAGAWWADLLDLGEIVHPERRRRALASIDRLNVQPVAGCPANEVDPDGNYSESWPLYALAYYAAQAISAGMPEAGWRAVERIYRVRQQLDGSHWDTPLEYAGPDNEEPQWGRWYMSTPASWYVWLALSGVRLDRFHRQLSLAPSWPAGWGEQLAAFPVFLPGLRLSLDCARTPASWKVALKIDRLVGGSLDLDRIVVPLPEHLLPRSVHVATSGLEGAQVSPDGQGHILVEGKFSFDRAGQGFVIEAEAV
jgi:uncharacterized protein (DUF608 family)